MKKCCDSPGENATQLDDLTGQLRQGDRKITGARQAILELLRHHDHPLTIKEIHASLPVGLCDLATVYRSMHLLIRMKMVLRFDFGDGVARFELVNPDKEIHHHHLICRACARVVELESCFPVEFETEIARSSGFKALSHRLDFFGLCPACQ